MPVPVCLVCSESGADDKIRNLASAFNFIETIEISAAPQRTITKPTGEQVIVVQTKIFNMRIAASWLREDDDDPDEQFEFQNAIVFPNIPDLILGETTPFSFSTPFHRLVSLVNLSQLPGPGVMYVENRIRKVGSTEWLTQRYPILLVAVPPNPESTPAVPNA